MNYSDITQEEVSRVERVVIYLLLGLALPLFVVVCLGAIVANWVADRTARRLLG